MLHFVMLHNVRYQLDKIDKIWLKLAATQRGSRQGAQSASLYDNFGKLRHYDVINDVTTRKL